MYFQAMLTSIIILIRISNTFTNCIAIGFNNGDHDYKYLSYCLSLIYSTMISFSITSSQATIHDIIQWIKQYVNNLNDTIDRNRLKHDTTSPSCRHMHCVSIDNNVIQIMELQIILSIDSFYIMIHHLLFEKLALIHVYDAIIIVLIGYAIIYIFHQCLHQVLQYFVHGI